MRCWIIKWVLRDRMFTAYYMNDAAREKLKIFVKVSTWKKVTFEMLGM